MKLKIIANQESDRRRIFTARGVADLKFPRYDPKIEGLINDSRLQPEDVTRIWNANRFVYLMLWDNRGDFLSKPCLSDLKIRYIDNTIGYGVFATKTIPADKFIGVYSGIIKLSNEISEKNNEYTWCYHPSRPDWGIDGTDQGNETRFINHSRYPNVTAVSFYMSHPSAGNRIPLVGDRMGMWLMVYLSCKLISQGEQLLVNYGRDFFSKKPEKERPL